MIKFFATVCAILVVYGLAAGGLEAAFYIVLRAAAILLYPVSMCLWIAGWVVLGATVVEKWQDSPVSHEFLIVCGLVFGIGTYFFITGPFVVEPIQELIIP